MWGRVDDKLHAHPDWLLLKDASPAWLLWTCLSWALAYSPSGIIPTQVARSFGAQRTIAKLVSTGWWTEVDGGYQIHNFHRYSTRQSEQATHPSTHELSEKRRAAGAAGAAKRWQSDGKPEMANDGKPDGKPDSNLPSLACAPTRASPDPDPVPDPVPPPTPTQGPDPVVAVLAKSSDLKGEGVDLVRLAGSLRGEAAAGGYSEARLIEVLPYALDELALSRTDKPLGKGASRFLLSVARRVARTGVLESELERRASPPERPGGATAPSGPSVSKSMLALVAPKVAQ